MFPDWAQINFNGTKSIDRVVVYSVQDNYLNPVEPTDSMTFSLYGLVDFTVQGWNGSAWVTLGAVTGNNLIKRTVTFPAFITDRIRVNITNALNIYSRITEIEAWGNTASSTVPGPTNVALASVGAVPSALSAYAGRPVEALNDNQRSGAGWDNGGGWSDATYGGFPDWAQINFNGTKSIDRVVVYSVQDNYLNPVEPTDSMTFSLYGLVDFAVQGWNGSVWATLANVTGNNLIKRTVTFPAFTTDRIRVNVANALTGYSRITEIEAWGNAVSSTAPAPTNVALASVGAVPSASSTYSAGRPVASLNDNKRSGAGWDNGGGWSDSTSGVFPDWAQINFNGTKSIDRVVVYAVQDNYTNPVEPTDSMSSSLFSLVDFTVQGWNGSAWVTLSSVTGNNLIKRTVTFPAFTTDRIRIHITNALYNYSRITEIEAWGQ